MISLRWKGALLGTSLAGLVLLGGGDPGRPCPPDEVCLFEDNSMQGRVVSFGTSDRDYEGNTWDGPSRSSPDDEVSSVVNNTNRWVVLYMASRWRDHAICVGPGRSVEDLESYSYDLFGHNFGDGLSSHKLGCTEPLHLRQGGPCDHKV